MKKVIKSKIFLLIITMIICISGTLYAASTYKATDIVYNSSDGSSMNVSEALNELYSNNNSQITDIKMLNESKACYRASIGYDEQYSNYTFVDEYDFVKISATGTFSAPYYDGYVKFRDKTINFGSSEIFKNVKKDEVVTVYCRAGWWVNTESGSSASVNSTILGVKLVK